MQFLSKANQYYKSGNYQDALLLYKKAANIYGNQLVKMNILLCEKMLGISSLESKNIALSVNINDYFDNIYLVSLPKDKKRFYSTASHLNKMGVKYTLYEAVNGYSDENVELFNQYIKNIGQLKRYAGFNELEVKRGKRFIESAGAIGYIKTYIEILKEAKKRGHKRILILEDDVILNPNFHMEFDKLISRVKSDWKVLQLGASQYNWKHVDNDDAINSGYYYPRQLDTCGSFAIAIDSSVFDELIEIQSCFESPFDHLALGEVYEKYIGSCYVCYPNIIMPDVGSSTIRSSRDQATHSLKMRWDLDSFPYPPEKLLVNLIITSEKNISYVSKFDFDNLPYDLNLYYSSVDGLRPIHDIPFVQDEDIVEFDKKNIKDFMLDGDLTLIVNKDTIITEYDLLNHITRNLTSDQLDSFGYEEVEKNDNAIVAGLVSIIIPTYKRPKNLKNALYSVLKDEYINKEIIVVNDNGNDTYDNDNDLIINEVRKNFPEIDILYFKHTKNRNGAAARNTGILKSSGEYICFLDDDDIYLSGRLASSIKKLNEYKLNNTIGGVYCGFLGWNSPVNDLDRYKEGDLTKELLLLDYKKHYLHTNTATYKRSAVMRINSFDESYRRHQDLEFNLRFFQRYSIKAVKYSGVRLNPEPSSISNKVFNLDMLHLKKKFLGQFKYIIDAFPQNELDDVYRKHWLEVKRYISDQDEFYFYLENCIDNPELQICLSLKKL